MMGPCLEYGCGQTETPCPKCGYRKSWDTIYVREWPANGQKLYSMSDDRGALHMSYVDVPEGDEDCAILLRIDWKKDQATVMEVKAVKDEQEAVVWYVEQCERLNAH